MKTLKVGIMPSEQFRQRVLDIAAGRYKPSSNEPKIWFSSLKSLDTIINENNTRLLALIEKMKPASLEELAELSGCQIRSLNKTLKTFERYGIIELKKENKLVKPIAKATKFQIEYKPSYAF